MDINEFQTLSREDQFKKAGEIAGVEPSVFDGIWRTESGRGVHMLSPAGAEGHFGLMPNTRKVWEQRFGTKIDPHDFAQSLFTSAHTMRENMGRFKDKRLALKAYNGGWDPKRWNNPETLAYDGKVLGSDTAPVAAEPSTLMAMASGPVVPVRASSSAELWNQSAKGRSGRSGPPADLSPVAAALSAATLPEIRQPAEPSYKTTQALANKLDDQTRMEANRVATTSGLDVARAGAHTSVVNRALIGLFREDYEPVAGYEPPEEELKGYTVDQQRKLRTAQSPQEFNRHKFDFAYEREQQDILFTHGSVFGIGAAIIADLPGGSLTGLGAAALFRGLGVGSFALAAQGRKGAALGAAYAEGVVGDAAYTAALDALGYGQTSFDYALAFGGGLFEPLLTARALGRSAEAFREAETAVRTIEHAKAKQVALIAKATESLGPNATPAEIAEEVKRLDVAGVRADVAATTAAVPEARKFNVGEEQDLIDGGVVKQADSTPPVAEAKMLDEPWESADHQAKREALVLTNPEWRKSIEVRTDGEYTPETLKDLPQGVTRTRSMEDMIAREPKFADAVHLAENLVAEYLPNSKVLLTTGARMGENGAIVSVGDTHVIAVNISTAAKGSITLDHTTMHEIGHAIFHQYAPQVSDKLITGVNKAWSQFVDDVRAGKNEAWNTRFAATSKERYNPNKKADEYGLSRDEWMAEQFVQHMHDRIQRGEFGNLQPTVVEQLTRAVKAVLDYAKGLVQKGLLGKSDAADEFYTSILRSVGLQKQNQGVAAGAMANPVQASRAADVGDVVQALQTDPIARKYGLDLLPMGTPALRAEAKQILALYKRADAWAAANPLDEKRLNKILSRFDSLDPISNQMLRSENPLLRMTASELLENGGGAAGRRSSAAIAKYMNERTIIGNVINELDDHFNLWLKKQGGSKLNEFMTGKRRIDFNKLVAEEIEQRRYAGKQLDLGDDVRNAADSVEGSFERARLMQIDAKTVGWASLPETSRGYMPHRMRADVLRSLTNEQRRALHSTLMDQFVEISGFDMSFADNLAAKYLDRIAHRALGGFDAPAGIHQTGASDIVREALEQMGMTRDEVDATMKRYVAGGAGHTKKRLNLDLRQTYTNADGSTWRLLDLFDTDMLSLVRGQSQRVSGEVALARHGIMGKPGMAILRRGIGAPGGKAKPNEVEAFDVMSAEFLGQPFGTQNKWVDRAMQANSVMSLGGMGFNQLGEIINAATTLGVKKAFSAISSAGRMRSEILALAAGKKVDNAWLGSIEKAGGAQFGTDAYKMVFPMDLPDAPIHTMGADTLNAADRLLRGAGHLQSKLSMWRTIHSTQQRAVAEEIVKSFAAAIHKGDTTVTLADMGLTEDVLNRLRADADNILIRDAQGNLTGFDIEKATDLDAANQLVQAVHRGANQIIQGTFIGETGKYVHNSYLKMLTQFRTFSLTAIDKQWNRQAGNHGVGVALTMMVGAMGAAAPIYMLRTYLASIGREDQQEYLEKRLALEEIARATTNYIATSGLAGDFVDVLSAVGQKTIREDFGITLGGRTGTTTTLVGNLVAPALGKVDQLWGSLQDTKDGTDVHGVLKEMPLSRLPWLIPAINSLGD